MTYGVKMMRLVGGLAERLNALVLKTSEGASPPRVRIPDPPPRDTNGEPHAMKVARTVQRGASGHLDKAGFWFSYPTQARVHVLRAF